MIRLIQLLKRASRSVAREIGVKLASPIAVGCTDSTRCLGSRYPEHEVVGSLLHGEHLVTLTLISAISPRARGWGLTACVSMHIARIMLLVSGTDRPLVDRIVRHLDGEPVEVVENLSFTQALERRASTLLFVESTPRAGIAATTESGAVASLVQAAEAPSVSRVIVVTTRVDTDSELRRLRRSGARYVILRPPTVIDVDALRGKRVLVPTTACDAAFVTIDDLGRAVGDAVRDRNLMGVTIDVPPSGLAALEAVGAKPRVVAPWRAKVGRWFKQPVFEAGLVSAHLN